jgi:hypothetical protein
MVFRSLGVQSDTPPGSTGFSEGRKVCQCKKTQLNFALVGAQPHLGGESVVMANGG